MAAVDPRIEERVGSTLNDKWTLEKLLGQGGMAAVYLAKHRNGARAAVKILHPELTRHPSVRERFLREGYAANKVEHRGTVQVLDDDVVKEGPDDGAAYIVMELLEGESLHDRMERPPALGDREVLEIMAGVLDVLEAAHARGVIHRDLKPDNLFLARDPDSGAVRIKVLDFGLARIAEAESVTVDGLALGTPHFMSPEQAAGRRDEIDGRTDIFALGATWFTIVAGRHVHEADNTIQVVVKMATEPAPPVRSIAPMVPEAIAKIIDKSLQFARVDRYPNAAAMRADVDEVLRAVELGGAPTVELYAASRKTLSAGKVRAAEPAPEKPEDLPENPPDPAQPTIALSSGDLESVPEAPRARRSGFPWLRLVLLIGAFGAAWVYWPQLRERFGKMDPSALPSAIADAGFTAASDLLGASDAAPTLADDATAPETDAGTDAEPMDAAAITDDGGANGAVDEEDEDAGPETALPGRDASAAPMGTAPHVQKPARKKPKPRAPGKPPRRR